MGGTGPPFGDFFVPPYYSYQSRRSHKTHTGALGGTSVAPGGHRNRPCLLASVVWAADGGANERGHGMAPRRSQHRQGSGTRGVGVDLFTWPGNFPPGDTSLCAYRRQICLRGGCRRWLGFAVTVAAPPWGVLAH